MLTINQSIDEKNELIFWKLSSIWMKILNDIACNLNLILIQFQLNSNTLNEISIVSIQLNSIPIQFKYIEYNLTYFNLTKFNSKSIQ
jgi:hypothetical protein